MVKSCLFQICKHHFGENIRPICLLFAITFLICTLPLNLAVADEVEIDSHLTPHYLTPKTCSLQNRFAITLLLTKMSTDKNQAYIKGARFKINEFNQSGGVKGRLLCLMAFDDQNDATKTKEIVKLAMDVPGLVGMVGLPFSSNAAGVVKEIGESGVPLISDISVDSLFANYENIFSFSRAVSDDIRAFQEFLLSNYSSAMFIGNLAKNGEGVRTIPDLFAKEFLASMEQASDKIELYAPLWIDEFNEENLDRIVMEIRKNKPEILCLGAWSSGASKIIERLAREKIHMPVFLVTGNSGTVAKNLKSANYPAPLYNISGAVPHMVSAKLAKLTRRKEVQNLRASEKSQLGNILIYHDLMGMIIGGIKSAEYSDIKNLRSNIVSYLAKFMEGQKVYHGIWRNWTFTSHRSSARDTFVTWAPELHKPRRLWSKQKIRTRNGLKSVPVGFLSVDLVRLHSIDINTHRFDADFYVSVSSDSEINITADVFSNAVKSESTGQSLVSIQQVNSFTKEGKLVRLYFVKGRFRFTPQLSRYPFDAQIFSVDFRPINSNYPFLIQPPNSNLLDQEAEIDGWQISTKEEDRFIGYEEAIISTVVNHEDNLRILPFYKFNFTWVAKRQTLDYYMRVVIPLALIMIVAYFSVFLPSKQVESVVAMQVTSLLAVIALYFSIPKPNTDIATLSDQIFVFAESVIVLLIMISILRLNSKRPGLRTFGTLLKMGQILVFPMLVLFMLGYVSGIKSGDVKPLSEASPGVVFCELMNHVHLAENSCQFLAKQM